MKHSVVGCVPSMSVWLPAARADAAECQGLAALTLKEAGVTSAQLLAAGAFSPAVAEAAPGPRGSSTQRRRAR